MMYKIKKFLGDPYYVLGNFMMKHCPKLMPDRYFLKVKWKRCMGYELDLKHPKTFNEKLQWLKLYDRKPEYTIMVDKYRAKQWVEDRVGKQYVIPTLAIYNSAEEIDLNQLPDQFVLKCNHDSGSVVICRDKKSFDFDAAKQKLSKALRKNYYWDSGEWPYKNVKPMILAEPFLFESEVDDINDYKFYCFDGEPKVFYITSNREGVGGVREDFFDINGNHLDMNQKGYFVNDTLPIIPKGINVMINLARKLSIGMKHLRVDFYESSDRLFVGELTFYDGAGFSPFYPDEWNSIVGDWIKLPTDDIKHCVFSANSICERTK